MTRTPEQKARRNFSRQVRESRQRALLRARTVETPEHLAEAGYDAYVLAKEVDALRARLRHVIYQHNAILDNIPRLRPTEDLY